MFIQDALKLKPGDSVKVSTGQGNPRANATVVEVHPFEHYIRSGKYINITVKMGLEEKLFANFEVYQ